MIEVPATIGVVIGRFQPPSVAHVEMIKQARKENDLVLVLVGSTNVARSFRNPFTFEERKIMLESAGTERGVDGRVSDMIVEPLADSAYDLNDWIGRVQNAVDKVHADAAYEHILKTKSFPGRAAIKLYGHYKDASSYYLNLFPHWGFVKVNPISFPNEARTLSSTNIREMLYEWGLRGEERVKPLVDFFTWDSLYNWVLGENFKECQKEYKFCMDYRAKWALSPYSPTFVTVDSVVYCLGHVLLVKRGRQPGKGLYALPGGFVNGDETLKFAAIRELKEETSIDVSKEFLEYSIAKTKVFDEPWRDPRGRFITHAYLFDLNTQAKFRFKGALPSVIAGDDANEAEWVQIGKLDEMADKMYADHYAITKNVLKDSI